MGGSKGCLRRSFPGENARSWEALGEARPGQSSLSAGALRYRAWAQYCLTSPLCWELWKDRDRVPDMPQPRGPACSGADSWTRLPAVEGAKEKEGR